jgi:hypothetical protein
MPAESAFQVKLSLISLLAVGLAGLAFVAVLTVLLAARRSILPMQQIKSVAVTLLWIVPALALVGLIGMKFGIARVRTEYYRGQPSPSIHSSDVYEEVRSTVRGTASTSTSNAVPVSLTKTTERQTGNDVATFNSAGLDGVLKVVEIRVGAPDWALKDPQPNDKGILVALKSQRFATLEEAAQQLTAKAVDYVKEFYRDEYPLAGDWTVPVSILERNAVRKVVGETLDQDFGNGIRGTMYVAHLQLELNSALRQGLHDSWHGQIVSHRLTVLGSMLGLMTLMLATSAGYFRLDDLTGGLYRRRLKFAAASLVAAGSLVALVLA